MVIVTTQPYLNHHECCHVLSQVMWPFQQQMHHMTLPRHLLSVVASLVSRNRSQTFVFISRRPQAPLGGENVYFAVFKQFQYILVLQLQAWPSHSPVHSPNTSAPAPLCSRFLHCSSHPTHTLDCITAPSPPVSGQSSLWLLCITGLPLVPRLVTTLISIYTPCNYNLSTREEVPTFPLTVLTS